MGIEYIKSVVYRIAQQANAALNGRSFCCNLTVDVTPDDTLWIWPSMIDVELSAVFSIDNGNASMNWCSVPCALNESTASIAVQPDTNWRYVFLIATEGLCQASDVHILLPEPPTSVSVLKGKASISVYLVPTTGLVTLSASDPTLISVVNVLDVHGRTVETYQIHGRKDLDLRSLPSGTYILQLITNGQSVSVQHFIMMD
jgi:hypothetical protein